jgi:pyridoxal phosphate enzyme (YggS family)
VSNLQERYVELKRSIAQAAIEARRDPSQIRLLAVSKTFPVEDVVQLFEAGQLDFGENYVQEARDKVTRLPQACWHLIGPLQRNKINLALQLFQYIHSVDSVELLEAIDKRAETAGKRPKVLLQVHLGEETSKSGFAPQDLVPLLDSLPAPRSLEVVGLMAIPPALNSATYFRQLALLGEEILARGYPFFSECQLSMGMSDDYPEAIREGANWIRVGRALFGYRELKPN